MPRRIIDGVIEPDFRDAVIVGHFAGGRQPRRGASVAAGVAWAAIPGSATGTIMCSDAALALALVVVRSWVRREAARARKVA